jgi:uncharacterized protein (TIGR02145 family)
VEYEGQTYNTVQIGTQCWLKENLNVGMRINGNQEQTDNGIIEKYCFENDPSMCDIYGGLYQWNEMMQYVTSNGSRGICPEGWHLPDLNEEQILETFLGNQTVAGGKMKEAGFAHWMAPNTNATNSSGFTALPGGYRDFYDGTFNQLTTKAYCWSSSPENDARAWFCALDYMTGYLTTYNLNKSSGFSARCIKNVVPVLNVPGSYQGWNPADSSTAIASVNQDEKYEGYIWFPVNTEFKYAKGTWNVNWGDNGANGTLEPNGANIIAGAEGYYKLNADLVALTHTFVKTNWSVIGSATPGGWGYDTEMTYDAANKVWSVSTDLMPGEILFRANLSWDIFYGDDDANGTLESGGDSIAVEVAGNYTITIDLDKPLYTYHLTYNGSFTCGSVIFIHHFAGAVAPVDKTVTYTTVTNIPGEPSKCWITSNLGADHQASSVDDATEASAGWYWQFNRKQGYKHDGTTRTPNTVWVTPIIENSDWIAANDPCRIELGSTWRIPTYTEWNNVDIINGWTDWAGPWNSGLKLHAAGNLGITLGALFTRGTSGNYHSSTQSSTSKSWYLDFGSGYSNMFGNDGKAYAWSLRCLFDF